MRGGSLPCPPCADTGTRCECAAEESWERFEAAGSRALRGSAPSSAEPPLISRRCVTLPRESPPGKPPADSEVLSPETPRVGGVATSPAPGSISACSPSRPQVFRRSRRVGSCGEDPGNRTRGKRPLTPSTYLRPRGCRVSPLRSRRRCRVRRVDHPPTTAQAGNALWGADQHGH